MSGKKHEFDNLHERIAQLEDDNSRLKKENEQLQIYKKIFDILPIGVTVCIQENPDDLGSFRFILTNPVSVEMTQFPNEKILGKTIRQALPQLLETEIPAIYAEVMQTQQVRELPELQYGDDKIPQGIFSVKIVSLDGPLIGIFYENITEKKRTEEAFQRHMTELEERVEERTAEIQTHLAELNYIYNTAPIGLAFLSPDLKYIRVNEMIANINGKPIADHLNQRYEEVIPELVPYIKPHLHHILETKRNPLPISLGFR